MKLTSIFLLFTLSCAANAYTEDVLLGSHSLDDKPVVSQADSTFLIGSFLTTEMGREPASVEENIPQKKEQSFLSGSFDVD